MKILSTYFTEIGFFRRMTVFSPTHSDKYWVSTICNRTFGHGHVGHGYALLEV